MKELPEGMQYRVTHHRIIDSKSIEPSPHGGVTVVEVGFPRYKDGKFESFDTVVRAESRCHKKDHYNRKRGRDIALGRALKLLAEEGHSQSVR